MKKSIKIFTLFLIPILSLLFLTEFAYARSDGKAKVTNEIKTLEQYVKNGYADSAYIEITSEVLDSDSVTKMKIYTVDYYTDDDGKEQTNETLLYSQSENEDDKAPNLTYNMPFDSSLLYDFSAGNCPGHNKFNDLKLTMKTVVNNTDGTTDTKTIGKIQCGCQKGGNLVSRNMSCKAYSIQGDFEADRVLNNSNKSYFNIYDSTPN